MANLFRVLWAASFLAASALAQPQDTATAQKLLLDEVRALRASMEILAKGQSTLIALARIQIDEGRIAVLEARRLQLLSREEELQKEAADGAAAVARDNQGALPTLVHAAPDGQREVVRSAGANPVVLRAAQASRKLNEVRRDRQAIENSIGILRSRIASWEKQLEEAERAAR